MSSIEYPLPGKFYADMETFSRKRVKHARAINSALYSSSEFRALPDAKRESILIGLEHGCYECATGSFKNKTNSVSIWSIPAFCAIYEDLCAKIVFNILFEVFEVPDTIFRGLIDGKLEAGKIAYIPASEMAPDLYSEYKEKIEARSKHVKKKKVSAFHKCPCGSNEIVERNLYDRALDEGVNTILECQSCGRTMKPKH